MQNSQHVDTAYRWDARYRNIGKKPMAPQQPCQGVIEQRRDLKQFFLTQTSFCVDLSGWSDTDSRPIHDVDRRITNLPKSKWAGKSPQIQTSPQKASHDGIQHPNTEMKLKKARAAKCQTELQCFVSTGRRRGQRKNPLHQTIRVKLQWSSSPHCKWYIWIWQVLDDFLERLTSDKLTWK